MTEKFQQLASLIRTMRLAEAAALAKEIAIDVTCGRVEPRKFGYLSVDLLEFVLNYLSPDWRKVLDGEYKAAMRSDEWKDYCRLEMEALSSALSYISRRMR